MKFADDEAHVDSEIKQFANPFADAESLWMIAPFGVIRKYLKDPDLLAEAIRLKKQGKVSHQLLCREDLSVKLLLVY